jgi:hypothetical protein
MPVRVILSDTLVRLEEEERLRHPSERRRVPTVHDLANQLDLHLSTVRRILNGTVALTPEKLGLILDCLREAGFDVGMQDVLRYDEPNEQQLSDQPDLQLSE